MFNSICKAKTNGMFTERCNAYFHDPDVDYQRKKNTRDI